MYLRNKNHRNCISKTLQQISGLDAFNKGPFLAMGKLAAEEDGATAVALPAMCILLEGRQEVEALAFRYPSVNRLHRCIRHLRSLAVIFYDSLALSNSIISCIRFLLVGNT